MSKSKAERVQNLKSTGELFKIIKWHGMKALIAKTFKQKTAWATAGFPIELLWAFKILPLHPENNACVSGARKVSQELCEEAESLGFSRDLCSYFKTNIGATETNISPAVGGIAKPSFVCTTNTICDTHVKWFQTQARKMNVPIFIFDIPSFVSGSDEKVMERYVDYVVEQMHDFQGLCFKTYRYVKVNEKRFRRST
jgi:benzoyl-CoA reductase/2-hydroxyglutaryl-CoA dehydratase subunit BcrC/BadD/HgdB